MIRRMSVSFWLFFIFLALVSAASSLAVTRGKARVAVLQPRQLPRQDPFLKEYDPAKVRPQSQASLENIYRLFERAGELGADIVCAPEDIQHIAPYGLYLKTKDPKTGEIFFKSLAQPVPGPISRRVGEIARKYHMYIIAPMYERDGDKVYNTALVVDRQGKLVGKYRKVHLPVLETWLVSNGDDYPVFDTDFARIAVAICWDISYPEVSSIYALKGADIIFNPTLGRENEAGKSLATGHRYITRAKDNSVYIAPVIYGSDGSGIIDFNGKVVAEAVGATDTVIVADIDFSKERTITSQWWININGTDNIRAMRLFSRRPETYRLVIDPNPPLMKRYRDVHLTTGSREKQLEALEKVRYGP